MTRANARKRIGRATARCVLAAVAVFSACVSTGLCSDFDPKLDLWPLVRYDSGAEPDYRSLEALWPVRAQGIHINALDSFDSTLRVKGLADILIPNHDPMFEKLERIP